MSHPVPTPLLSGENLLTDDNDIILLTDEILPSEEVDDIIELCELDDRSDIQEFMKFPDSANDKTDFIDLCDVLEEPDYKPDYKPDHKPDHKTDHLPELSETGAEKLSGGYISPDTEYRLDDLQHLIDEVVQDSHAPHRDFPGIYSEFNKPTEKDAAIYEKMVAFQPMDQIEAVMERVIRNLFAERIGLILDEIVTTTVTREIENLKTILLDYLASGQSAGKIKS